MLPCPALDHCCFIVIRHGVGDAAALYDHAVAAQLDRHAARALTGEALGSHHSSAAAKSDFVVTIDEGDVDEQGVSC